MLLVSKAANKDDQFIIELFAVSFHDTWTKSCDWLIVAAREGVQLPI